MNIEKLLHYKMYENSDATFCTKRYRAPLDEIEKKPCTINVSVL